MLVLLKSVRSGLYDVYDAEHLLPTEDSDTCMEFGNDNWKFGEQTFYKPRGAKRWVAEPVYFSDNRLLLNKLKRLMVSGRSRDDALAALLEEGGKGSRKKIPKKRLYEEDDDEYETEEEEIIKPPNNKQKKQKAIQDASASVLAKLKVHQEVVEDKDEIIKKLKEENSELRSRVEALSKGLPALKELPNLIHGLRGVMTAVGPYVRPRVSAPPVTPTPSPQRNEANIEETRMKKPLISPCASTRASRQTVAKRVNDLMKSLWSTVEMAERSMTGGNGDCRAGLDPDVVSAIIDDVKEVFSGATESVIKQAIRQKLSNSAKIVKRGNTSTNDVDSM